ncbi:MAG: TIGR02281 family clan AA aspartic protease [Nitrospinaceae bacterium]
MSNRSRLSKWALVLTLAASLAGEPALAKVFKWVDADGKVHFTDSLSKIPRQYRKGGGGGVETLKSGPPEPSDPVVIKFGPPPQEGIQVPLTSTAGNTNFFVDATLNGSVKLQLLVDTGASFVTLHPDMAPRLGIRDLEDRPHIEFSTAGGTEKAPIAIVDVLQVGDAVVEDVQVSFIKHMPPEGGLLGMTFLNEFRMGIDRDRKVMVLKPIGEGGIFYGGRPPSWWQEKYSEYTELFNRAAFYGANLKNRSQAFEFKKQTLFYQDLLDRLNRRADRALLPQKYRIPLKK